MVSVVGWHRTACQKCQPPIGLPETIPTYLPIFARVQYGNLQGSLCVTYSSQPVHGQRDGTNTWPRTKNDRNGREPCVVSSADWRGRAAAQCLSWSIPLPITKS